jgi:hypothetical protein
MRKLLVFTLSILFTYNCAVTANAGKMTVTDTTAKKTLGENIIVEESTGGSITLPFWIPNISDDNFTQAVKDSLINSKIFKSIATKSDTDWKLRMIIIDRDHPWFGIDMTVTTTIKYTLYLKDQIVFDKTIVEPGTATASEMFIGVYRAKRANEYSARNNIKKFISELEALDIKPEPSPEKSKGKK